MADRLPLSAVFRTWCGWALVTGGIALLSVLIQWTGVFAEPAPSVGAQIGEIAGEIRREAWRAFIGLSPPPAEQVAAPVWHLVGPALGVLAVLLAAIACVRGENREVAAYGACLGGAAIFFQLVMLVALLIVGAILLVGILKNMDGIFGI